MKLLMAALFFAPLSSALACDPVAAIREYYVGPEMSDFRAVASNGGIYSLSWTEEGGVVCQGAKARVNAACEVEVVKAAFCEYR